MTAVVTLGTHRAFRAVPAIDAVRKNIEWPQSSQTRHSRSNPERLLQSKPSNLLHLNKEATAGV